ncbi:MAG: twin transmembrane helix small protein [Motiliproteus sp.]|nr:twin transmembrane helix small protein [Motiliproteus sp.]
MDIIMKLPVLLLLIFIIGALARGMYCLAKDDGSQTGERLVKALTIRIALSFLLFGLLIGGYLLGFIQPHG